VPTGNVKVDDFSGSIVGTDMAVRRTGKVLYY
jgi:hypothetical protein